ncbi:MULTISPECIES: antiviral RADAR system adenosine deaminase RdrB [Aeromonas]|uniref:antiviral RADAR system adenosine deaminase RdrB n=1 Tax=Aeromonas TaxID=642 RepID=UPI0022E80106|nr:MULTISPECIES: antiviral RADAR system adenosine deaminase RdrB [Aeromonas]
MLQRTLTEHAAECFFSDQRLAGLLWDTLLTPSDALESDRWHQLQDDFYHFLVEGIEARYPREHRLTDVRQLMGRMLDGHLLLTPTLPWLNELQQRLLQRNGDLLCYREGEIQAYVRLAAGMDPTLLAGWHLAQWLDEMPQPQAHDIRRVVSAQTAFFAPPGNPSLPFAEGHVHFWGVTADSAILDDYLLAGQLLNLDGKASRWQCEQYNSLQPLLHRARQLLVLLLEPYHPDAWPQHLARLNLAMDTSIRKPDWDLLATSLSAANLGSADWLLGEFAMAMDSGEANRWLWLYVYLCRRYNEQHTHPLQRSAILCFWQTVNQLRRSLIMDGQGLTRFAERYYQSALGRGGDYQGNIRRLWVGQADLAEIKSGPLAFKPKLVGDIARGLIANASLSLPKPPYIFGESDIKLDMQALATMQAMERRQFCGHFSRSKTHQQNQRPKPNSEKLWQDANTLMGNLQSASGWNTQEFLGGKLNPNFHFQPARWFRGLDVAGDENALKIEWFAPVLRWLRSGFKTLPDGEGASTGFHLSIHAGEDYAHPASGMRHIDETVRFCEMREGDRLGHALALGIVPKQWAARQGEMLLPLDEHLDNLVWLWHHASVLSCVLPLAQQVLPLFERRIARFWRRSTWWQAPDLMAANDGCGCDGNKSVDPLADFEHAPLRDVTPNDLYQAWYLRRNCHFRLNSLSGAWPVDSRELSALPDHQALSEQRTLASQLYQARHRWLDSLTEAPLVIVRMGDEAAAHVGFVPKGSARVGHKVDEGMLEDVDTPAELEFMHALQDWLLTEYDKLGLIIEANPTSNVYIARLQSHAEHPIFRWYPPDESVLEQGAEANLFGLRRGPVRVLVNTDDPGIMPTTLRTEFLLLREAALELKVGRTVAERWLETLRQYGLEQFHRNHLPVFEPV